MRNNFENNADSTVNFIICEEEEKFYPAIYEPPEKKDKSPKILKWAFFVFLFIIGGFSLGFGIGAGYSFVNNTMVTEIPQPAERITVPVGESFPLVNLHAFSPAETVEIIKPAVVVIETTTVRTGFAFFQREFPAAGTGIVFREDNERVYIVTNEHVISGASEVNITFHQGRPVTAYILGRSHESDLAVLYVLKSDLERAGVKEIVFAEFGDSSQMQTGDFVLAIGNALGQGITTTMGVVSALDIVIPLEGRRLNVLQTDAAINPGNSGGPLVNSNGQVIGINTVKMDRANVYGIGYSITSNAALPVIERILNREGRPLLGILGNDVTSLSENFRQWLEIGDIDYGIIVRTVHIHSGAYRGGLQVNDVILYFDNNRVDDMNTLINFIGQQSFGDQVELIILRNGEELVLNITFVSF